MTQIFIVGAGPGDRGLLTVRAREVLLMADICFYDRLIAPETLALLPSTCERVYVGKGPADTHRVAQATTQQLMIAAALAEKKVVRLKGGDPFIFGRGAEEAEACVRAGLSFEIIPGISSALAAPLYAGIPLTHRDAAGSFTVITAHQREDGTDTHPIRWELIAPLETLVFMMGVARIDEISTKLQQYGRPAATPIAIIENGTFARQRTIVGTLQTIAEQVVREKIQAPSIIVVGEVVKYREQIQWFEKRPLFGKTIWVTRDAAHGSRLSEPLRALGANVIETPIIEIKALPVSLTPLLSEFKHFQWLLLTSRHAVVQFMRKLFEAGADVRVLGGLKIGAVGPGTVEALLEYGLKPDLIPQDQFSAEGLLDVLPKSLHGQQVLFPKAKVTRDVLINGLIERGAMVHTLELYETVPAAVDLRSLLDAGVPDLVTFTASSIVECFVTLIERQKIQLPSPLPSVSIGPITSEILRKYTSYLSLVGQANEASLEGLLARTVDLLSHEAK